MKVKEAKAGAPVVVEQTGSFTAEKTAAFLTAPHGILPGNLLAYSFPSLCYVSSIFIF